MGEFTENTTKHIEDMKKHNWKKYPKVELLDWLQNSFNSQQNLVYVIERKELIIEQLEKQIESMKSCHTCIYSDKTNFHNYTFKCNTCASKCNWSNDFDSLEFLEAEDYEK